MALLPTWHCDWALYKRGSIRGNYECVSEREYTRFGNWMGKIPGIIGLPILIVYYLITCPIWAIYHVLRGVIYILITLLMTPIIKTY